MSKLLQVTSALALIFMSSETFASNVEIDEVEKAKMSRNLIQLGKSDQEIADFFKNLSLARTPLPSKVPVPTPDSKTNAVSVTPTPTLEKAVQDVFVSMATLSNPGTADHKIFEGIYLDVHRRIYARTKAGSKDYSIIEWINKIKGSRLYNPSCWGEFQKKAYAHDQCDIDMVSSGEQLSNIQAIFYKAFFEKSQKKITELHEVGSRDKRSIQEIIDSMSRAKRATVDQQVVNSVMNVKKNLLDF